MRFVGADPSVKLVSEHPSGYTLNYFHGADRSRWVSDVHGYATVTYEQLWPGIDLRWGSEDLQVKYDLLLQPGADVNTIAFAYDGVDDIHLNGDGGLTITTSLGEFTDRGPTAWYADDHAPVKCAFRQEGRVVGFSFAESVDRARAIVIDPVLAGATYSGTNANKTYGYCGAYDSDGNIYGAGTSFLSGFPTTLGAFQEVHSTGYWDIAINKFNADASQLIWSTYLGGAVDQSPLSIVTNSAGEIHVLGSCYGSGYPTTAGSLFPDTIGNRDIVVTHLNATGSALLGSTYLGGSLNDGFGPNDGSLAHWSSRYKGKIELDSLGNIWLICTTASPDYPTSAGALQGNLGGDLDAVVTCLSGDCSTLVRSTYLGGLRMDQGADLALAANGDVYVCGTTSSADLPVTAGSFQDTCNCVDSLYSYGTYDGFVARLSSDLSTELGVSYYGTPERDWVYFMDLDGSGHVYLAGLTDGNMPIDPPGIAGQEGPVFIARFDPTLATRELSTTLGNGDPPLFPFIPAAFGIDDCDRVNISGFEAHHWLPTTNDAFDDNFMDADMIFMAAFSPGMSGLLFGSYYGGSHIDGGHSRFDQDGVLYQGICSHSGEMPSSEWAFSADQGVTYDLCLLKVDLDEELCDANVGVGVAMAQRDALSIFPVPASTCITVGGAVGTSAYAVFDVIDMTGRTVLDGVLPSDRTLNIGGLASGSYSLRLIMRNGAMCSARFIKD